MPLEKVTIQLTNAKDVLSITLLDLSGRIAYGERLNKEINAFTSPLPEAGAYILQLQTSQNKEHHEKIIIY